MGVILCYSKCWPCMFGSHTNRPHTWMADEDLVHAKATGQLPADTTRTSLTESHPCNCHCVGRQGCVKPGAAPTADQQRPLTHGASAWRTKRCTCDVCRSASRALHVKNRAERAERLKADPTLAPHGEASTYTNWGCRCAACSTANTVKCGEYRAAREARR